MDTQTIFCNEDIISELWKHISIDTLKQLKNVSKDYNSFVKNITNIDYISRKYKESDNITDFVSKTSKEICKKYNYPSPKLINPLSAFLENEISEKGKIGIGDDIYLIYYWIILLLHAVNNNYNEILVIVMKIDYKKKVNKSIIELFLKVMRQPNYKIFGRYYGVNKYILIRYISCFHVIQFSKHQFKISKKYVEAVHMKQTELIKGIKCLEIIPNRWKFPKNFCLKLVEILEK